MFSDTEKPQLGARYVKDSADGPDATATVEASDGATLLPAYASSADGSATAEVETAGGTVAAISPETTLSLVTNRVFGSVSSGDEIVRVSCTNSSAAAAGDTAHVRAIEIYGR